MQEEKVLPYTLLSPQWRNPVAIFHSPSRSYEIILLSGPIAIQIFALRLRLCLRWRGCRLSSCHPGGSKDLLRPGLLPKAESAARLPAVAWKCVNTFKRARVCGLLVRGRRASLSVSAPGARRARFIPTSPCPPSWNATHLQTGTTL